MTVYGEIQYKSNFSTANTELLGGDCFWIKKLMYYAKDGNVKPAIKYLCETLI